MARINNAITFGAGFNISAAAPIDSRMRVQYESDLTNAATWSSSEAPLYDGLSTVVMETGEIWVLKDKTKFTDKTTGQGWVNKGKGSEIDDNSTASDKTWSALKISSELSGKADASELTSYATIAYVTTELSSKADASELTSYATIAYVTSELSGKQNTLTTGTNISISGAVISADGYVFNPSVGSFAEKYKQDSADGGQVVSNSATALGAHAEGYHTSATGGYGSHAEGNETTASGYVAHAEGDHNTASGISSHAEGDHNTASGDSSHAEGGYTTASGNKSHTEGYGGVASGIFAHAEGQGGSSGSHVASGKGSHVEGNFNIAQNFGEHAEGAGNISHRTETDDENNFGNAGNTIHSIGIGRYVNNRKNAVEVMQNGDCYIYGIGNYDGRHIKGEQGAPANTQTLQEVIADLSKTPTMPAPNEVWYTTTDGLPTELDSNALMCEGSTNLRKGGYYGYDCKPVSNIYMNGKGVITYDTDFDVVGNNYGIVQANTNIPVAKLTSVYIPGNNISFWGMNFGDQIYLTDIYFGGTMAQCEGFEIDRAYSDFINVPASVIHCIDGDYIIPDSGGSGSGSGSGNYGS